MWRRITKSRLILLLLLAIAIFLGRTVWQAFERSREVETERERVARALAQLEARKLALETDLALLGSPEGQEVVIRRKFPVVKPGEKVITVVPPREATTSATTAPRPWWRRLIEWFVSGHS